jgi:hypothetical protein
MSFKVGDIVRLITGSARLTVTHVSPTGAIVTAKYCSGDYPDQQRPDHRFTLISSKPPKEPKPMATPKLFVTLAPLPIQYGTLAGKNSQGLIVFEVKPSGDLLTLSQDQFEEVRPHTVTTSGGKAFEAPQGLLAPGDVILIPDHGMHSIAKVDSKAQDYSPLPANTRRVLTEALIMTK